MVNTYRHKKIYLIFAFVFFLLFTFSAFSVQYWLCESKTTDNFISLASLPESENSLSKAGGNVRFSVYNPDYDFIRPHMSLIEKIYCSGLYTVSFVIGIRCFGIKDKHFKKLYKLRI